MKGFMGLIKRNLLIYFKDIQAVIFSLLTSIIVFVLYLLFIKSTFVDSINDFLIGLESLVDSKDIDTLVSCILLTGVLGSAMITVPFNCLSTIVNDKEKKIDYDICATPMKRWQIIFAYFLSATISSIIITGFILTIGIAMLSVNGSVYLTLELAMMAYGIVILGSLSSTALFMILMMFFKTTSASGAFFGMLSAASGFVIGAYMPLSNFSKNIQTVCSLFPATHVTALMRTAVMGGVLDHINDSIGGLDNGAFADGIKDAFTFNLTVFDNKFSNQNMTFYIIAIFVISALVMMALYSKTYKRK